MPGAGAAPGAVHVTTNADSGAGSLRAALAGGAQNIVIDPSVGTIDLASPLVRSSAEPLRITGTGQIIDATGVDHALWVVLPGAAAGTVEIDLRGFAVTGSDLHGIYIDDNLGSPASLDVSLRDLVVDRSGIGASDQDGVRVDERDAGSITFRADQSTFTGAGADGVELDETGDGDVVIDVQHSSFIENGPFDPSDLDDGIDVDETDAGSVLGSIRSSSFVANFDEGVDLNEDGAGSLQVTIAHVTATDTVDGDGVAFEEHGDGHIVVDISQSTITGNGDEGVDAEQTDAGSGSLRLHQTDVSGNADDDVSLDGVTLA